MVQVAGLVGDPMVRNLGTIGGSLAHADPAADWPASIIALGAEMVVEGARGKRTVKADDFFKGLMTTAVGEDEILTEVRVPRLAANVGAAYMKFPHPASRFAVVGVCAVLTLDAGKASKAGVGITGAGTKAVRAKAVEAAITGKTLDAAQIQAAADKAAGGCGRAGRSSGLGRVQAAPAEGLHPARDRGGREEVSRPRAGPSPAGAHPRGFRVSAGGPAAARDRGHRAGGRPLASTWAGEAARGRGGEVLIRRTVRQVLAAGIGEVIVVVGPGHRASFSAALDGLGVSLVINPAPEAGQSGSLRVGVDALPAGVSEVLIALGDQPELSDDVVPATPGGARGNGRGHRGSPLPRTGAAIPFSSGSRWSRSSGTSAGDQGARSVIDRDPSRVALVPFDRPMPADVDTAEDLRGAPRRSRPEPVYTEGTMREEIKKIRDLMESADYVTDPAIATSVHLAMTLRKPLLIEGHAGVGKTEVAKVMSRMLDTRLIRLQCYEGLDAAQALYEWNYPKQILHIKLEECDDRTRSRRRSPPSSPSRF